MKKTMTDKQRAANKRDALKSTGPRTKVGKARSARNAVKHGLLARSVVVEIKDDAESHDQFNTLHADLVRELKPRTILERTLVERVATCYWRLARAQRFESGAIRSVQEPLTAPDKQLDSLRKKRADIEEALAVERRLQHLLDTPDDELTPDQRAERDHSLKGFADAHLHDPADPELTVWARDSLPPIIQGLQAKRDRLAAELESTEQSAARQRDAQAAMAVLPHDSALLKVLRYETMLDRQLYRALDQLRRLRSVPHRGTNAPRRPTRPRKRAKPANARNNKKSSLRNEPM